MIVRISTEGQYELPDTDAARLNEIDNETTRAVEAGDEARFHELWRQMIALVETDGRPLDGDDLVHSDVILPPRDTSFEEAKHGFSGEGLIPEPA
jgi:hypothetical protein